MQIIKFLVNNLNYGDVNKFSFHVQAERKKNTWVLVEELLLLETQRQRKKLPQKKYLQTGHAAYELL